jgi:hypothetical protein
MDVRVRTQFRKLVILNITNLLIVKFFLVSRNCHSLCHIYSSQHLVLQPLKLLRIINTSEEFVEHLKDKL